MKLSDLIQSALLGGLLYVAWKLYKGARGVGEGAGSAVYDWTHYNSGQDFDTFRVIDGAVLHIAQRASDRVPRIVSKWDDGARRFVAVPESGFDVLGWGIGNAAPDGWEHAPQPLPQFYELRAQGRAWYSPWDGGAAGARTIGHGATGSW